jgi:hypothetical protein
MSDKSANFHRLAEQRVEAIEDKVRIFSNLSGPSYEWTPEEVNDYFEKIRIAVHTAHYRFFETKRWQKLNGPPLLSPSAVQKGIKEWPRDDAEYVPEDYPASEMRDNSEPESASQMAARAKENPTRSRQLSISEIIHEASEDMESLAEMIVLQRRVIDDLQTKLDRERAQSK